MTVGSLTTEKYAKMLMESSGLDKYFDPRLVVLRDDVKQLKPSPDVWDETAERAGVNTTEQLVFEDSPRGILGAVTVGCLTIGMPIYNRPDTVNALVEAGAHRVFMNWDEINTPALIKNLNEESAQSRA